jgi:hypothetical protein
VLRGRGRPRRQAQLADLRDQPVHGPIVERGRRRVRNRTGGYELQYQVEFVRPQELRCSGGGSTCRDTMRYPTAASSRTSLKGMASRQMPSRQACNLVDLTSEG